MPNEPESVTGDERSAPEVEAANVNLSPQPPAPISLNKIEFADEISQEAAKEDTTVRMSDIKREQGIAEESSSIDSAIQDMRAATIRARSENRKDIGSGASDGRNAEPQLIPVTPDAAKRMRARTYRVMKDHKVRAGGRTYKLNQGKVVSENHYDINHLKKSGVELKEIED